MMSILAVVRSKCCCRTTRVVSNVVLVAFSLSYSSMRNGVTPIPRVHSTGLHCCTVVSKGCCQRPLWQLQLFSCCSLTSLASLWSSALAYANYVSLPFTSLVFQKGFLLLLHVGTLKCSQDHQCSCASSLYLYLCSSGYLFSCGGEQLRFEKARTTKAMYYRMFPTCSPSRLEWGKK